MARVFERCACGGAGVCVTLCGFEFVRAHRALGSLGVPGAAVGAPSTSDRSPALLRPQPPSPALPPSPTNRWPQTR